MVVLNNLEALDHSLMPQKVWAIIPEKSACTAPRSEPIRGSLQNPRTEVESLNWNAKPDSRGGRELTTHSPDLTETLSPSMPPSAPAFCCHPLGNKGLTSYLSLFPRRRMDEGTPSPLHLPLSLPQEDV